MTKGNEAMKKNAFMTFAFAAVAALAMPLTSGAVGSEGDIVSIQAVPVADYGEDGNFAAPHKVGDTFYVRVRLLNENWMEAKSLGKPHAWLLERNAMAFPSNWKDVVYAPALRLAIGAKKVNAVYSLVGPNGEPSGQVNSENAFYTDYYFSYKVQEGELGLPVRLVNSKDEIIDDAAAVGSSGFYLVNVNTYGRSDGYWNLSNDVAAPGEEPHLASFWYSDPLAAMDPSPLSQGWEYPSDDTKERQDVDKVYPGIFVQTINFDIDDPAVDEPDPEDPAKKIWRKVYRGLSDNYGRAPAIDGVGPTTVYVWSDDETVVVPEGEVDTSVKDGRTVIKVTLKADGSLAGFKLRGKDDAAAGQTANICLCSQNTPAKNGSGVVLPGSVVTRKVMIENAPDPYMAIGDKDGNQSFTVEATTNTSDAAGYCQMRLTLSTAFDTKFEVNLNPKVLGSELDALADRYVVLLSAEGDPIAAPASETKVTVPPKAKEVYFYLYVLGSCKDLSTVSGDVGGLQLTPTIDPAAYPEAAEFFAHGAHRPARVKVTDQKPTISVAAPGGAYQGAEIDVDVLVDDNYRDLTAANESGYTVEVYLDTAKLLTSNKCAFVEGESQSFAVEVPDDADPAIAHKLIVKVWDATHQGKNDCAVYERAFEVSKKLEYDAWPHFYASDNTDAAVDTRSVYCEGESPFLRFALSLGALEKMYAQLVPQDATSSNLVERSALDKKFHFEKGDVLSQDGLSLKLLDGDALTTPATVGKFSLKLFTEAGAAITTFDLHPITFTVTNAAPRVEGVRKGDYANYDGKMKDGELYTDSRVPSGVPVQFSIKVSDLGFIDSTSATTRVKWEWTDGPAGDKWSDRSIITVGTNGVGSASITFSEPDVEQTVSIYLQDRDQKAASADPNEFGDVPAFTFRIKLSSMPTAGISFPAGTGSNLVETTEYTLAKNNPAFYVKLSEFPSGANRYEDPETHEFDPAISRTNPLVVRVTVPEFEDNGMMEIHTNLFYFGSLSDANRGMPVYIERKTQNGGAMPSLVNVTVEVLNTERNKEGTAWRDYFGKTYTPVYFWNASPSSISLAKDGAGTFQFRPNTTNTWTEGESIRLKWTVQDIAKDLTNGNFTVQWEGITDIHNQSYVTLTNGWKIKVSTTPLKATAEGIFEFKVPSAEMTEVTLIADDGEDGQRRTQFWIRVVPTKKVSVSPFGPALATQSKYGAAGGVGRGHVYVEGSTGNYVARQFLQTWTYNESAKQAELYAVGYPAAAGDAYDDGTLGGGNYTGAALDANGNKSTSGKKEDCYNYGRYDYDSFFYTWVQIGGEEGNDGAAARKPTPAVKTGAVQPGTFLLDSEKQENTGYGTIEVEAIFSKERYVHDNMGDINKDGVPDLYVQRYNLGGGEDGASADDLADLDKLNDDEDYLPSTAVSAYGSFIPGLPEGWKDTGTEFGARLEIRGYGDGLNDATELAGLNENIKPDRVYETAGGGWDMTKCSISQLEYLAWKESGLPAGKWSPERPTDPTKADTDGDGFPDGYEYYFWYNAHVGYMSGGSHKYLTGRAYDPRNPGGGKFIPSALIARLMDPRSDLTPVDFPNDYVQETDAKVRDTDNDGLPDLLEFEIGTNPFDFDTDGDGLPDGFEIMLTGTDPLLGATTPGISDAMRNFDGDAMAYTTPELEEIVLPTPFEIQQWTSFAFVDPDGDSDGVQWYVSKEFDFTNVFSSIEVETVPTKVLVTPNGRYVAAVDFKVTDTGYLATDLTRTASGEPLAYAVVMTNEMMEATLPVVLTNGTEYVRLAPALLPAGTRVLAVEEDVPVATAYNRAEGTILAKNVGGDTGINTAWVYGGTSVSTTSTDNRLLTSGGFGALVPGRYRNIRPGQALAALPSTGRTVAHIHNLVYQEFGFDPRTGWNYHTPLAPRWGTTYGDGETGPKETIESIYNGSTGYAGVSTRTREYTAYDEFLLLSYFLNGGVISDGDVTPSQVRPWYVIWSDFTTNAQGPNEPNWIESDHYQGRTAASASATNGADTDMDGVPDGWELYVMTGPKEPDLMGTPKWYRFGGPHDDNFFSHFGPLEPHAGSKSWTDTTATSGYVTSAGDGDGLTELEEFMCTDGVAYYSGGPVPFSDTIVRSASSYPDWLNKFFPTDPWESDTDLDGISDYGEYEGGAALNRSHSFVYGTPVDNGSLTSIPGGGLNPCSVDTDLDGLPDGWESQYPGQTIYSEEWALAHNLVDGDGKPIIDYAGGSASSSTGTVSGAGNPLQGLVDGMDGTVKDAFNTPYKNYTVSNGSSTLTQTKVISVDGARQVVDRDYDHDGLSNWQEYLTGAMRCWRYDDPHSPWGYVPTEDWYDIVDGTNVFNMAKAKAATGSDSDEEFWYKALVDKTSQYYSPRLATGTCTMGGYLSWLDPKRHGFDPAFSDDGAYYIFYDRIDHEMLENLWGGDAGLQIEGFPKAPSRYISCSPIEADSDHDGMDDYYELFHGMNPLLGASGVAYDTDKPCDLVFDAWRDMLTKKAFHEASDNKWTRDPEGTRGRAPRSALGGNYCDFELFPWLNGMATADPDGDDIRNQEESVMPMVAPSTVWHHTDPTPLWMTDSSYTNSLVTRFFRIASTPVQISLNGQTGFEYGGQRYNFFDVTGGYFVDPMEGPMLEKYNPEKWKVVGSSHMRDWIFSFEENEGYDSDHDVIGDDEELAGKFSAATDPLDFDSPRRRQAMYFPGKNAALQSMPYVHEQHPVGHTGYPDDMSFAQFTVECWVCPERATDQTIIERAIWSDFSNPGDQELLRKNFLLGITNGYWYAKFDTSGTLANNPVEIVSGKRVALNVWTHLAATYDANTFTFYVNGVPEPVRNAHLLPEYGSSAVVIFPGDPQSQQAALNQSEGNRYWCDREYEYVALLVGASFKGVVDQRGKLYNQHLNVMNGAGWSRYKNFFQGYVDEVRIWDGARTLDDIVRDMSVRYTAETAKENREAFYQEWAEGNRRYAKDRDGNDCHPIPELRYHFSFDSIPGAAGPAMVEKVPFGFGEEGPKAYLSRPEGYEIPWWKTVLDGYEGTVYSNPAWIQWIPNTVTHLPRYDLTTLDSAYWSEDFAGDLAGAYRFARTAEPVSMWTQYGRNAVSTEENFFTTDRRYWQVYTAGSNRVENLTSLFEFTGRHLNQMGDDLVPLGGAYVKYVDTMWDEQGPSSNWEISGSDADNDGLPDWWSEYAKDNYRRDDMDPGDEITWNTIVNYHGRLMTAGEAYRLDLAKGYFVNEYGEIETDPAQAAKRKQIADEDRDGMYDWWESVYDGVQTWSKDDARGDPDHDGLSNAQEFRISQGDAPWGFTNLNPSAARSFKNQRETDYFLRVSAEQAAALGVRPDLYLGEIVADHDMMEDDNEDLMGTDRTLYDAYSDNDEDGWCAFSEMRYATFKTYTAAGLYSHIVGDTEVKDFPTPVVHATLRYNGEQVLSGSNATIVVEAYSGNNLNRKPNARYTIVPGSTQARPAVYLGKCDDRIVHGTLTPGYVVANLDSISLQNAHVQPDDEYSWLIGDVLYHGTYAQMVKARSTAPAAFKLGVAAMTWQDIMDAKLEHNRLQISVDGSGQKGHLLYHDKRAGEIDLETGDFTFDLSVVRDGRYVGENVLFDQYVYRIAYETHLPALQTGKLRVSLAEPDTGMLTEGATAFVAFMDVDGDGAYTPGEPLGFAKDIDVGWDNVPELEIEMTDHSVAAGERFEYPADAQTIRVIRTSVNGSEEGVKRRIVYSRNASDVDRTTVYEGDLVTSGKFGLDWGSLRADLLAGGYRLKDVTSVGYTVVRDTKFVAAEHIADSNIVEQFVVSFAAELAAPTCVSPSAKAMPKVETQRPTFTWSGTADNTAFMFQIRDAAETVVYSNAMQVLPPRDASGHYAWTAPVFIGTNSCGDAWALDNRATYSWRVAMFNPKYSLPEDAVWSDWAVFETALAEKNDFSTKYGSATVSVSYFGPATNSLSNVVVRLYRTADFTGVPAAQARLANLTGRACDLTNGTDTVTFGGLASGSYYAMAFVDRNGDGVRQRYETWGYANQVGRAKQAIYTPVAVTVDAEATKIPSVELFMEDTDVNQNDVLDVFDDLADLETTQASSGGSDKEDVDGDGLDGDTEIGDTYTDKQVWDSDGDGMPDGWEAKFADLDPLYFDADLVKDGDVMAYVEVERKLVTDASGKAYLLNPTNGNVRIGDTLTLAQLTATYNYAGKHGVGTNFTDKTAKFTISKVETVTAVLVHAQVYDEFGFSQKTAVAMDESVNTKPFTALDKYLVVRYLEAQGLANEQIMNLNMTPGMNWKDVTLKPFDLDHDRDGVADGWELYVMFGTNGIGYVDDAADSIVRATSLSQVKISPWNSKDARSAVDIDGDGLDVLGEFNDGKAPMNPWNAHTLTDTFDDKVAHEYNIASGATQLADDDNDGLSNWAEYLATQADYGDFRVDDAYSISRKSDQYVLDYFQKVRSGKSAGWYAGESYDEKSKHLIADHDFIEDWWEDLYDVNYVNRYVYDFYGDADGDGWSNWSEARARTDPTRVAVLGAVGYSLPDHPVPLVCVELYTDSDKILNSKIVFQAWRNTLLSGVPSATWKTTVVTADDDVNTRYIGRLTPLKETRYLSPGSIEPQSVDFWWYNSAQKQWEPTTQRGFIWDEPDAGNATTGTLTTYRYWTDEYGLTNVVRESAGTIDYLTGAYTLDPAIVGTIYTIKATYKSAIPAKTMPTKFYLHDPEGADIGTRSVLREGNNNFIAFADLNNDNAYTAGEPFGFVRDVKVGWDKVPELKISLSSYGTAMPRFELARGNVFADRDGTPMTNDVEYSEAANKQRVKIVRSAINGKPSNQLLFNRVMDFTQRSYLTDADLIRGNTFALDWEKLAVAAQKIGISPSEIKQVDYRVVLGDGSTKLGVSNNVALVFFNKFDATRVAPVAVSPGTNSYYKLLSAQPTFQWTGSDDYTAYQIELAANGTNESDIVWRSGIRAMPPLMQTGYSYAAPIYVGCEFDDKDGHPTGIKFRDGSAYYWRVTQYNAKFCTDKPLCENDQVWSAWSPFFTATDSELADSGYGKVKADIRYYGNAQNGLMRGTNTMVTVEAYATADFTGYPLARVRLPDGSLDDLAKVSESAETFLDPQVDVSLDGLAPGNYYLLAYIDLNTNGVREVYEPWGYACHVGKVKRSEDGKFRIWEPEAISVKSVKEAVASAVIFIEDTDVNQNMTPDSLEDMSGYVQAGDEADDDLGGSGSTADADGDGLTGLEEDEAATDPQAWDTDGDGMPDGWEAKFADTDPTDAEDGAYVVTNDVMAYMEVLRDVIRVRSTATGDEAIYLVPTGTRTGTPKVGDNVNDRVFSRCYYYGTNETFLATSVFGMGAAVTVPSSAEYQLAEVSNATTAATGDYLFASDVLIDVGTNVAGQAAWMIDSKSGDLYRRGVETNFTVDVRQTNVISRYDGKVKVSLGENRVIEVLKDARVALVHAQVYDEDGFSPKTAVAVADAVNTKPFTALDKYLVGRYLEALGLADEKSMNRLGVGYGLGKDAVEDSPWAKHTLKPGLADYDLDGIADGWELYVMFGTNEVKKAETMKLSPWNYDDARALTPDGDEHRNIDSYNDGVDAADPWDAHSLYKYFAAQGLLLPGTPEFKDSEVNERFGADLRDATVDDDIDLISNFNEWQAYYRDPTALADLSVTNAWSDGETPDYFRACGSKYLGELFNGAEFIEPDLRKDLGITMLSRTGTRDAYKTGWSLWSMARSQNAPKVTLDELTESEKLDLVLKYMTLEHPDRFNGQSLDDVIDYIVQRNRDRDVTYLWALDSIDDVIIWVGHAGGGDPEECKDIGYSIINKTIREKSGQEVGDSSYVLPEPSISLMLKYAGNEQCSIMFEAYQVTSIYPEYGEQVSAKWALQSQQFVSGVAKIDLGAPSAGMLVEGPARFVAYIDVDGDGKFSAGDTFGETTANVGYLGCDLTIRMADANTSAFPVISLVDETGAGEGGKSNSVGRVINTVAIVRTKVNGEYLEKPRGVMLRRYENNVNRTRLYPSDFVDVDYIGIDRYLSEETDDEVDPSEDELPAVEEVTYEIVKLRRAEVKEGENGDTISNTNLNHYVWSEDVLDPETEEVVSNILHTVDQQLNEEFTVRYSVARDVPMEVKGEALSTANGAVLSFTVPTDRTVTKFWLEIGGKDGEATKYYGPSDRGFALDGLVQAGAGENLGRVILDADWFTANNVTAALTEGTKKVRVALGNDKFPVAPTDNDEWSAVAEFAVAKAAERTGVIDVKVKHPTEPAATFAGKLTVAVYEKADLANPVAVTNGCSADTTVEIAGLRPDGSYYVAAWYVKDAKDGRGSADDRMPYDTWGYLTMLGRGANGFDAKSVKAVDPENRMVDVPMVTNLVFLQDTDWNDNGILDRTEDICSKLGKTEPAAPEWDPLDVDGDGIPNEDDDDPVFDNSGDWIEGDVMAYQTKRVLCVQICTMDAETNWVWYVVNDPANEPTADRQSGDVIIIPRGTRASELTTLYTTYVYGRKKSSPYGIGRSVTLAEGQVYHYEWKDIVLVHNQVYQENGFNPNTANALISEADWVNSKKFTKIDKFIVTNYLAAVGALATDAAMTNWVLRASDKKHKYNIDFDFDGIPDGWELYTMFGDHEPTVLTKTSVANILNAWVAEDRDNDPDGDELTNLHEYDGGNWPTDPWNIDTPANGETRGDGVTDYYAYQYHLKGDDAWQDFDGDGLSNYAEYLISEVFRFAACDPDKYATSDGVCDYFRKVGDLYLGEIFMDHDQVDNAWEHAFASGANMYVYDPFRDDDNDGWSNWAESNANTDPTATASVGYAGNVKNEYPVPLIEAKVVYNGNDVNLGPIVFKAWNEKSDPAMTSAPDAIWMIGNVEAEETDDTASEDLTKEKYVGRKPLSAQTYVLGGGSLIPGSVKVQFVNPFIGTSGANSAGWYLGVWDRNGQLVDYAGRAVGTVDYNTGVTTVDFSKLSGTATGVTAAKGTTERVLTFDTGAVQTAKSTSSAFALDSSEVKIVWQAGSAVRNPNGSYWLADSEPVDVETKSHGHVREGLNTFICFADTIDANGKYDPGEPFGVVRGVDVGWQGAKFTVELSETSAITPRVDVWASETSDRSVTFSEYAAMPLTDRTATPEQLAALSNVVQATSARSDASKAHLRVVRFGINGMYAYRAGVGFNASNVIDRVYDKNGRSYLCEADFLQNGEFDIEWSTLKRQVIDFSGVKSAFPAGVTNVTYLAVLDGGADDKTWIRGPEDTNGVIRALGTTIERRFERTKHSPAVENVEAICYAARPTFRWSLPNEEPFAKKYGTSYTAFKLQVWSFDDEKVYDSGVRRAPAQDKNGVFSWTADLSAGDLTELGELFATPGNYQWRVAMYNAKFQPVSDSADMFSAMGYFSIAANTQQEVNDHQYSSIDVAVKYAGPSIVLAQCADLETLEGKVRVQAFATADFAGDPLSETVVTAQVDDFASTVANARLVGLDATGTYYVRAYIDSNGNHRRDAWESWGAAKSPVVLSTALRTAPLAGIWIEDTDVDNDWLPDAWEYVKFGTVATQTANVKSESKTIFTTAMEESAKTRLASISTGLEGASLTIFENGAWAKQLLDWGDDRGDITFDDIRAAVQGQLDVKSGTFKITSLTLGPDGKVTLTVDAEVAPTIAGTLLSTVYDIAPGTKKTVKLQVYRKSSLAMAGWGEPVKTVSVELGSGEKEIRDINVGVTADDMKSGFYKIDIVE